MIKKLNKIVSATVHPIACYSNFYIASMLNKLCIKTVIDVGFYYA